MEISVIGLNHRSAPLHLREQYSLPQDLALQLLRAVRKEGLCEEALVLDTCNRTEFYSVARRAPSVEHLLKHIASLKRSKGAGDPALFYHHHGSAAVEHLFRVAASLDSQVIGEHEILGEIKAAYRQALEAHTARFTMNRLMHRAFRVGKRVQTETRLGWGVTSLSESAVNLSHKLLGDLSGKRALLIGAGQTAELTMQALLRSDAGHLIVANRSLDRARCLADQFLKASRQTPPRPDRASEAASGECPVLMAKVRRCSLAAPRLKAPEEDRRSVRAVPLSKLPSVLPRADLIVSSTGSPKYLLTRRHFAGARRTEDRPLLIMDLAVPRDVDPRVAGLPNISLYNLDDLGRIVGENLQRRSKEIPRAEAIVSEEVRWFGRWLESLGTVRVIKLLRAHAVALQEAEVRRYRSQFPPADRERLELFARGLCSKLLRDPISFLRAATASGETAGLADVESVRRMFHLDSEEDGG